MNEESYVKIGPMKLPSRIAGGSFNLYVYEFGPSRRYVVLERGAVSGKNDILVRVESNCVWAHVFGSARCDCAEQMHEAMRMIVADPKGGLLIHAYDQDGRGLALIDHVRVYMLQDQGFDTVEADKQAGFAKYDRRDYGDAIKILSDFKQKRFRLLTNNPDRLEIIGEHFDVVRIPLEAVPLDQWNAAQIFIKKEKMGHLFSFDPNSPEIRRLAEFSIKEGCKAEYKKA